MSFDAINTRREGSLSKSAREGAKALISTGERVLLVKERHSCDTPFWTLPGGGVEPGESQAAALQRELAEELGCRVTVGDPVDSVVYAHHTSGVVSTYTIFECTLASAPEPNLAEGILNAQWVRPDEMPPETLPQIRSLWW
jgi:8-oxo-dGTP diphosphatase